MPSWDSYDSPKLEYAMEARAWWTGTLIFFREMALLGFPREGKLDLDTLDQWIDAALTDIRERFQLAGKSSREQ